MDLDNSVTYRGTELNSISVTPAGIVGCQVEEADTSEVELRQFVEPLALQSGFDVAGVWLGHRWIRLSGHVSDLTRGKTFDRLFALEALFEPTAPYVADPTTFGYAPLIFSEWTPGGALPRSINVLSHGLRYSFVRSMFGGEEAQPLAIPWTVTLVAKDPNFA